MIPIYPAKKKTIDISMLDLEKIAILFWDIDRTKVNSGMIAPLSKEIIKFYIENGMLIDAYLRTQTSNSNFVKKNGILQPISGDLKIDEILNYFYHIINSVPSHELEKFDHNLGLVARIHENELTYSHIDPMDDVHKIYQLFQQIGILQVDLTHGIRRVQEWKNRHTGFDNPEQIMLASGDYSIATPNGIYIFEKEGFIPYLQLIACNLLERYVDVTQIALIDDKPLPILNALKEGIVAIHFTNDPTYSKGKSVQGAIALPSFSQL
jgi:hypothetical protein